MYKNTRIYDDYFCVTLYFHGSPNYLKIPFASVLAFADPSVNFGLQLKVSEKVEPNVDIKSHVGEKLDDKKTGIQIKTDDKLGKEKSGKKSGEVLKLDSFRKKE